MVIEGFEISKGKTVKRMPLGTKILSVSLKKEFEIGRMDEKIFITLGLEENKVSKLENREFVLVPANEPFVMDDHEYHGTVVLTNQTEPVYVLSRVIEN